MVLIWCASERPLHVSKIMTRLIGHNVSICCRSDVTYNPCVPFGVDRVTRFSKQRQMKSVAGEAEVP
jgi:hypothetical protein